MKRTRRSSALVWLPSVLILAALLLCLGMMVEGPEGTAAAEEPQTAAAVSLYLPGWAETVTPQTAEVTVSRSMRRVLSVRETAMPAGAPVSDRNGTPLESRSRSYVRAAYSAFPPERERG